MARHKRFSNFEGQITEDMLTERQLRLLCVKLASTLVYLPAQACITTCIN